MLVWLLAERSGRRSERSEIGIKRLERKPNKRSKNDAKFESKWKQTLVTWKRHETLEEGVTMG